MNHKIGFFKSFWYAITNFEKYKEFAFLKGIEVVKYVAILLLLFSLLVTVALTVPVVKTVKSGIEYFEKEFPDLTYNEGKLVVDSTEPIYLENGELDFSLLVDTDATLEEQDKYMEEQKSHSTSVLMYSDKMLVKTPAVPSYTTYEYTQLEENMGLGEFNKQDILDKVSGNQIYKVYVGVYLFLFVYTFLIYIVMFFMDAVILSILAYLVAKIYKVALRYSNCLKLSFYALTLPIVLQVIYIFINTFTGFTIEYFTFMYDIISYIYVITAILIMRNDMAKQDAGLIKEVKIKNNDEEEIITNEEVNKQKEEKKKKEEKDKDKEKNKVKPDAEPGNA